MKKVLAAAALASCALGAQAGLWVVPGNSDPSTFLDLTNDDVFTQADIYYSTQLWDRLQPAGTAGAGGFLAAGRAPNSVSSVVNLANLEMPTSYVSFLWGSPDTYNQLTVMTDFGNFYTFDSTDGFPFAFDGGDVAYYVGFQVDGEDNDEWISSLTFSSVSVPNNAFEASNFSVTPVPEPETYALMLAGLGVVGFMARRRKAA